MLLRKAGTLALGGRQLARPTQDAQGCPDQIRRLTIDIHAVTSFRYDGDHLCFQSCDISSGVQRHPSGAAMIRDEGAVRALAMFPSAVLEGPHA